MDAPAGRSELDAFIAEQLSQPAPAPALAIARLLAEKFPDAAIFLYGSGITVSAGEDPTGVMYDYYVMATDYRGCISSPIERVAARLLPPNVYYIESPTDYGVLRAKYAVLTADHLDRLVSRRTFHSYFWARFAQPMRVVAGPEAMRARAVVVVREALATFLGRAAPLAGAAVDWREVWLAGLRASYKSELRAESGDRAGQLLNHIAGWAEATARLSGDLWRAEASGGRARRRLSSLAWRLRSLHGALLSVARLLKATATFKGGIEYIAWKIARHSGIDVGLRDWERRHPFIAAPMVAVRYYRLRAEAVRQGRKKESLT